MEKYIKIKRYNDRYSVSNYGNIISHIGKGKELKKQKHRDGYLFVTLCDGNKCKSEFVHRLVAEHFLINKNNYPQVDHIDECKTNNYVKNLQWISSKENTRKSQSRKIYQKDLNNNILKIWDGFGHVQEYLGFNKGNIQKCCAGKKPTMYGFKWEYV